MRDAQVRHFCQDILTKLYIIASKACAAEHGGKAIVVNSTHTTGRLSLRTVLSWLLY